MLVMKFSQIKVSRDMVINLDTCKDLKVALMFPPGERNQFRWFGHLIMVPPRCLPVKALWACPTGRRAFSRLRTHWRLIYPLWFPNVLGSPCRCWRTCLQAFQEQQETPITVTMEVQRGTHCSTRNFAQDTFRNPTI